MPVDIVRDGLPVIAIGDLHGNYDGFVWLLKRAGLIGPRLEWIGQSVHLIQLGDVFGRGGKPGKIYHLLRRLQKEAPAFKSRVHILLGNHELMALQGMHAYLNSQEIHDVLSSEGLNPSEDWTISDSNQVQESSKNIKGSPCIQPHEIERLESMGFNLNLTESKIKAGINDSFNNKEAIKQDDSSSDPIADPKRRELLRNDLEAFLQLTNPAGSMGGWLSDQNSAIIINDSLYVHGGLSEEFGIQPIGKINQCVRQELSKSLFQSKKEKPPPILWERGPHWSRNYVQKPNPEKEAELERVLDYHDCSRMIVGHTPTFIIAPSKMGRIIPMYKGKLWCIDTGIGRAYGQHLSAARIEESELSPIYP